MNQPNNPGDNPMKLNDVDHDDVGEDAETYSSLDDLNVPAGNVLGTVFVIQLDAPLPEELSDYPMPTGPLLARLQPLASDPEDDIAFVPVSGQELLSLARAWTMLREAKKVAVLMELPGSRDDLIFSQARRQIGLKTVDWPSLSEAFASRKVEKQRAGDKQPWLQKETSETATPLRKARGSNLREAVSGLPGPEIDDDVDSGEL
jgi:hypothetical protein